LVFVMLLVLQFLEKLTQGLIPCGSWNKASTKAFTTQITVLTMIALRLKKQNFIYGDFHMYLQE
jgi:hypothetical protein